MTVGFGCDHAGVELKDELMEYVAGAGHQCIDYGTGKDVPVDYPVPGQTVAKAVRQGEVDKGILICGTGIGISLAANKVRGIRAAVCSDVFSARMCVEHNDCQILAIGARVVGSGLAKDIVHAFLNAAFEGGRHARRVGLISAIEEAEAGEEA